MLLTDSATTAMSRNAALADKISLTASAGSPSSDGAEATGSSSQHPPGPPTSSHPSAATYRLRRPCTATSRACSYLLRKPVGNPGPAPAPLGSWRDPKHLKRNPPHNEIEAQAHACRAPQVDPNLCLMTQKEDEEREPLALRSSFPVCMDL